jgi:DNA helicase-2/ATP-dependent DNA helicase PcrA
MAKKETNDPYGQFQEGDHVKHPKFGEGQILHRTGSGEDTKFVVSFAEEGEMRLMAKYAKLKKVRPIETGNAGDEEE